jgi:hypothetical protein
MKHFLAVVLFQLFTVLHLQAQNPCNPNELVRVSASLDSPCEAYFGTTSYFNFATIIAQRNQIRTGTLLWEYRSDTINGVWQSLPTSWQGQSTEVISKPDFSTNDNGQYRCIFTDTATGCEDFRRTSVYVKPRPQYSINVDSVGCDGLYLGTQLQNDSTQVLSHCWEPDFSSFPYTCDDTTSEYLFARAGCMMVVGTVEVIVTNQYGCENTSFISGLCNTEYLDTYTQLNAPDSVFCAKTGSLEVRRFSNALIPTSWTYQWFRNGNALGWATNPIIKPLSSGTYNCRVTNTNGCSIFTNEISVTVNPLPTINIQPSGTTEICNKDTLVMSSGSQSANSFAWFRNGQLLPQNTVAIGVFQAGNYRVTVTTPQGCSATSPISKVSVYRSKIQAAGPVVFCAGDSVVLQNFTANTVTRQWQLNNVSIPGATAPVYAAKQSGLYRVKSTNNNGCISYSNQIDVNVNCRLSGTQVITEIYPVPATDFITIGLLPNSEELRIRITDMAGKLIKDQVINAASLQNFPIAGIPSGIYLLTINDGEEQWTGKFIRE